MSDEYKVHIAKSLLQDARACVVYIIESNKRYDVDSTNTQQLLDGIDKFLETA